jgi:hypothetical protein
MEASTVGFGLAELVLLLLGGQFLGTPPGERDPELIKAVPPAAYVYCEWTAPGAGQAGAPGIEGLLADPEIQSLLSAVEKSLTSANPASDEHDGIEDTVRRQLPKLLLFIARHPGCLYLARGEPGNEAIPLPPLEGAFIVHAGDDAGPFLDCLNRLLALIPGYDPNAKTRSISLPLTGVSVAIEQLGPRVICTLGAGTLDRLQARWQAPEGQLPSVPAFNAASRQIPVERFGSLGWLNLASLRDDLQTKFGVPGAMIHAVGKSLGLSGIDTILSVSGVERGDVVTRTHLAWNDHRDGLLTLFSGRPLNAADFAHVPADADFVVAVSLNLGALHRSLRDIVVKTAPDTVAAFDEFQRQLEHELQLNWNDVFQGFGDVWTVYDSPSSGGLFVSGLVAAVPVTNSVAAQTVVRRFESLLAESLAPVSDDGGTTLNHIEFEGATIHYFSSTGYSVRYDGEPPFSPAFCLTDRHLLVALHPQALKAHLRFVTSAVPRFDAGQRIPAASGELLSAVFVDTPRIGQTVYSLLPFLLKPAVAEWQAQGMPIDIAALPSARAVLPYLRETTATVVRRRDGLVIEQRNTLPVLLALMALPRLSGSAGGYLNGGSELINLHGTSREPVGAPAVQLGAAEGVVPAKVEETEKPARKEPSAIEKAARRTLPVLVRSVIPDEVEGFIPPVVFQRMAEPPDPEQAAQRAAARERRKAERAARRAARMAK